MHLIIHVGHNNNNHGNSKRIKLISRFSQFLLNLAQYSGQNNGNLRGVNL